jgi:cell division protein FtsB
MEQTMPASRDDSFKRSGMQLVSLILVVLIISLVVSFIHQVIRSTHLEAQRKKLVAEVATLEAETTHLKDAVDYVESDAYVERVAREQLGYAHDGDVVVLPEFVVPTPSATPTPVSLSLPPMKPNWQIWWQAVFSER